MGANGNAGRGFTKPQQEKIGLKTNAARKWEMRRSPSAKGRGTKR